MWCKNCNVETNEEKCPICGEQTVEVNPTEVYWCDDCKVPVMQDEKLIEGAKEPEDYIIRLYEFIEEFNDRFNSEISSDDILNLCMKK